jgi:hypothetical protein
LKPGVNSGNIIESDKAKIREVLKKPILKDAKVVCLKSQGYKTRTVTVSSAILTTLGHSFRLYLKQILGNDPRVTLDD